MKAFICLLLTIVLGFGKLQAQMQVGTPIPPFLLAKPGGGTFSNIHLTHGTPVIVMIFNPDCPGCLQLITDIKAGSDKLSNAQLLLVTEGKNKDMLQAFIDRAAIGNDPLFQNIGADKGRFIPSVYSSGELPYLMIYDNNHRLIRILSGNISLDTLGSYLR